jgi:hypothetical protein
MIWNLKTLAVSGIAITTLVAGTAWYSFNRGSQYGMSVIQTQWDAEKLLVAQAQAEEQMKARQTEQALQATINRIRQEKTREATRLANDYAAVINSLHDRPKARADTTGVPEGAVAGVGCTGSGLARDDAEFLAGYARDAGRLQLALDICRKQYAEVKSRLNSE